MGRPVDADSAETYDRIVAAAVSLLREKQDAPSLRKVAERAEVSLGTIQYYFVNKEELLEACLDGYYGRMRAMATTLLAEMQSRGLKGRALLEHASRAFFAWSYDERALVALRIRTNTRRGELHPNRQGEFMGDLIKLAATSLAPHIEVSELDARLAIQSMAIVYTRLVLLTDSEVEHLTDRTGSDARDEIAEFAVRMACRLLVPRDD